MDIILLFEFICSDHVCTPPFGVKTCLDRSLIIAVLSIVVIVLCGNNIFIGCLFLQALQLIPTLAI